MTKRDRNVPQHSRSPIVAKRLFSVAHHLSQSRRPWIRVAIALLLASTIAFGCRDASSTVGNVRASQIATDSVEGNAAADETETSITGRVVDELGVPIPNAEVRVGHYAENNVAATAGEDGRFSLAVRDSKTKVILVSAPGKAIELANLSERPGAGDRTVVLNPSRTLKIRIMDEKGQPIPGVQVSGDEWRGTALLVHFTTDKDGCVEWHEAPVGGVEYFISKPGYCQLLNLKLEATGNVQEVMLPRVLKIAGRVSDVGTSHPVEKFEVMPVLQFEENVVTTDRSRMKECCDGVFSFEFDRPDVSYALRIEADGYRTQMTPFVRVGERTHELDVEMQQAASCAGVVLTYEGTPATNADVFLATPTMPVELSGRTGRGNNNLATKTNENGVYRFPAQFDSYRIVVVADEGFADMVCHADEQPGPMRLQPWSRVGGAVTQAGQPMPGQTVTLKPIRLDDPGVPRVNNLLLTKTKEDGAYSFAYVPPGKHSLQSVVSIWQASELTSSEAVPLEINPGQDHQVQLGGNGTDIVGRVRPVGESEVNLSFSLNYLLHKSAGIAPPDELASMGFNWTTGWNDTWNRTPEGVVYQKCLHHWMVKLARDGSFRICGVPAGEYELSFQLYERPVDGCLVSALGTKRVSFEMNEQETEQELDLGLIEIPVSPPLRVGDAMPDFSFEMADGSTRRLSAYRGQWLLVDLWATWCAPCLAAFPELSKLHDELSSQKEFVLLGVSLDRDVASAKEFAARRKLAWPQGFLGGVETIVRERLGITTVPAYLLVDPEGRLVARSTIVAEVRKALDEALLARREH